MTSPHSETTHRTPDRVVFATMALVCAAAFIMLLFEALDRFGMAARWTGFYAPIAIALQALVLGAVLVGGWSAVKEMKSRRAITAVAIASKDQVEQLFHMAEMLQSALGQDDANAVLRATALKLLPGLGGALYVFNSAGDRLELSTHWAWSDGGPAHLITPSQCWALKRGKPHLNTACAEALRCDHHNPAQVVLELPMIARGQVHGMLQVHADGLRAEQQLNDIEPVASALADAMSLALANLALRDKPRTQALRDPLTGLYNRRFVDDALDRYANLAERNKSPLSLLMVDLDQFKQINDEHGHALGDSVLVAVAAAIMGFVRPCDLACRFGGEEFVVVLPDCALTEASAKAEALRKRIGQLSDNHGFAISASIGVATLLETSTSVSDALAHGDAALHQAKSEGRNRVVSAPLSTRLKPKTQMAPPLAA